MKDYKVQCETYFSGTQVVEVRTISQATAIVAAQKIFDERYYGGNYRRESIRVIGQKKPAKTKWKVVKAPGPAGSK